MNLRQQAMSGVKWTGISNLFTTALQFGTIALLARLLEPSDFGLMSMLLVITSFAQIFVDAGVSNALIYHQEVSDHQLSSLYWLNVGVGFFTWFVLMAVGPLIVAFYQEPRISAYLGAVSAGFVINGIGQQFRVLMRKELRFQILSLMEMVAAVGASIVAILIALSGWGIWSLVLRLLVQYTLLTLMSVIWAVQHHRLPRLHFRGTDLKGFVGFGLFQMADKVVNALGSNADSLLIGRLLGAESLGYYSLASQIIRLPLSRINPIVNQVAFPTLSIVQAEAEKLRRGYLRVVNYISTLAFPLLAGMFVVAPIFIETVYGAAWMPVVPALRILCLVGALRAQGNPIGVLLLSKGRADIGFYWDFMSMIAMIAAVSIGANWGIEGVALSTLVALLLLFPFGLYLRWRVADIRPLEYLACLKVPASGSLIVIAVLLALGEVWNDAALLVSLFLQVGLGGGIYAAFLWVMDRSFFMSLRQALLS